MQSCFWVVKEKASYRTVMCCQTGPAFCAFHGFTPPRPDRPTEFPGNAPWLSCLRSVSRVFPPLPFHRKSARLCSCFHPTWRPLPLFRKTRAPPSAILMPMKEEWGPRKSQLRLADRSLLAPVWRNCVARRPAAHREEGCETDGEISQINPPPRSPSSLVGSGPL
jgi:hypothetical protein